MKPIHAKFGVFQIYPSGSEELYRSRDLKGKPLMSWSEAVAMKQYLHDHCTPTNNLNLIVRPIKP